MIRGWDVTTPAWHFLAGAAGLAALLAVAWAPVPARAQCYPGLACPTDQTPPAQPEPGPKPRVTPSPGDGDGAGARRGAEYHYVGTVRPPDDWLALRTLPTSREGERIMKMPQGTLFRVMRKRGEWWYVTLRDGTSGWAHSGWIVCCKIVNE